MSTAELTHDDAHAGHVGASASVSKFGMIMFLASEAMLFAGLIAGYFILRISRGQAWPPDEVAGTNLNIQLNFWHPTFMNGVMILNSFILIGSSFLFHGAEVSIKKKGKSGIPWLILTLIAGGCFLSVQAFEWYHLHEEGLWFNTHGVYGSTFFVITGFHGAHVFIGLCLILWCLLRQLILRCYTPGHTISLDNVGLYWHFVDIVWIFVYTILYVI